MSHIPVLGPGNPLLGDDGTGLALLDLVAGKGPWPADVDFVDGGTWGLSLMPDICRTSGLLVLDAVRAGEELGTVLQGADDAVPRFYSGPLSPHQIDRPEVLATTESLGAVPARLMVVGIEPAKIDVMHVGLGEPGTAALPAAADAAAVVVRAWLTA